MAIMLNILFIPMKTHTLSMDIIISNRVLREKIFYPLCANWLIGFIFLHTWLEE